MIDLTFSLSELRENRRGMKTLGTSHEKEEFDLGIERNCVIENHWIVLV